MKRNGTFHKRFDLKNEQDFFMERKWISPSSQTDSNNWYIFDFLQKNVPILLSRSPFKVLIYQPWTCRIISGCGQFRNMWKIWNEPLTKAETDTPSLQCKIKAGEPLGSVDTELNRLAAFKSVQHRLGGEGAQRCVWKR